MKASLKITGLIIMNVMSISLYAQKTISEGILTYTISTQTETQTGKGQPDPLKGATNTIYIKGGLSRTDMVSPLGRESTIYDSKTGTGVILKEYSGQKLMITLTKENWLNQNKRFEGISFVTTSETKSIAGYSCTKATAKLNDGSLVTVYYASDVIVINKEYNQAFKTLPGLPVQYEFENGKMKFQYLLIAVNFASVPALKFDFPKSGYRVMSYDESQQSKKAGI